MHSHHHTLDFSPNPSRVTGYDPADPLRHVDSRTSLITLSTDPTPQRGIGTAPRRYIGGTVWLADTLRREHDWADELLTNCASSVLIQIDSFWLPFRQGDVRYPTPAHVRLARGDDPLHDTHLRSALRWD